MVTLHDLNNEERSSLLRIIQQSLGIRRHVDVFLWLNGELQNFLPHEILIAAWGDFARGSLQFDVISAIPGVRTNRLSGDNMAAFAAKLFEGWRRFRCEPYLMESSGGFVLGDEAMECLPARAVRRMSSALVHGVRDVRGNSDCLYISLSSEKLLQPRVAQGSMELLLPHLDLALRRLHHVQPLRARSEQLIHVAPLQDQVPEEIDNLGLSMRELEIMDWVRQGKTNQEIGLILDISVFTVKNHLQRVFKKLDVLNRAQAVARMSPPMRGVRAR
jgi:transcriptional regulator EpsA